MPPEFAGLTRVPAETKLRIWVRPARLPLRSGTSIHAAKFATKGYRLHALVLSR